MVASSRVDATGATAWISWLRVLAIVGVVAIHTTGSTAVADRAGSTWVGRLAVVLDIGAIAAVPLFVMLSGALLLDPDRYRGPAEFLRRRAARLVPAIVFWHLWYLGLRLLRGERPGVGEVLRRVAVGELYTQLYFLWIVLGLALVTPLLMPLLRRWGRRGALVVGAVATTATAVAAALRWPTAVVHTLATWWLPYLGYFLLGWGLRGVRVRGATLLVLAASTATLAATVIVQWSQGGPTWLSTIAPVSYYGAGVALCAVGIFGVGRALLAPDGVLRRVAEPPLARVGRTLGDVTLGVFGIHLTVIAVLAATGWLGGGDPAPDVPTLLARVVVVLVVSYAVALTFARVPGLRRVV